MQLPPNNAAAMATRRQRNQRLSCYYEGYLERRSYRDKTSRKLWTCLCGSTLFFFNTNKDADYVEKLDLIEFCEVTDDCSRDQKLDAARFTLHLKDQTLKFTAPSLEARELWKGFIHAVVELSVCSDLNLLPGQIHMLKEAVEKEEEKRKKLPYLVLVGDERHSGAEGELPACYLQVSRVEAELLLERAAERGNLLLRPGGHGNTFTVTTRVVHDRPVFKHYRVTQKAGEGFIIELQKPIPCPTLHDVIALMMKETGGTLTPFVMEERYEDTITFIKSNEENGEKTFHLFSPSQGNAAPPPPPKPVSKSSTLPGQSCEDDKLHLSEPFDTSIGEKVIQFVRPSSAPPPLPTAAPKPAEQKATLAVNPVPRSRIPLKPPSRLKSASQSSHETEEKDNPSKALKPVPAPRGFPPASPRSTATRARSNACAISEELKLKFAKKRLSKDFENL